LALATTRVAPRTEILRSDMRRGATHSNLEIIIPQGLGFRYTQASPRTASSKLRHESLGRSYAAEAVLLESLIAPLYLCMRVTVEALEDWRYVDAIDRVLEACLAGAAWHPVRDAEAPEHRNSCLSN
jgi:hypothetical protein